ncbi:unnamed protein product [Acidithrix sp. C25]|nr:unnamed protein product [Acidithrix sp. C25]
MPRFSGRNNQVRVLIAMSGGVDSSVAALMMKNAGHEVVGATMKLWGGVSDSGCCSVSDVADARMVAGRIGIDHHVFNFTEEFESNVVDHYVKSYSSGLTPNPCIECNRKIKFDLFIDRALRLGFDMVATGHYARVEERVDGFHLLRGIDPKKDQSYVISMLNQQRLGRLILPIGDFPKEQVREIAKDAGLITASKPDSQDVCFIASTTSRVEFLSKRTAVHEGVIVDSDTGSELGKVEAIETVTIGQRRGLGTVGDSKRRYVIEVRNDERKIVMGTLDDTYASMLHFGDLATTLGPIEEGSHVMIQTSSHGYVKGGTFWLDRVELDEPIRKVAPGQTVAFYRDDEVLGSGVVR